MLLPYTYSLSFPSFFHSCFSSGPGREGSLTQRGKFSLVECWLTFSYLNDLEPGLRLDTHVHTHILLQITSQSWAKETFCSGLCSPARILLHNVDGEHKDWSLNFSQEIGTIKRTNVQKHTWDVVFFQNVDIMAVSVRPNKALITLSWRHVQRQLH